MFQVPAKVWQEIAKCGPPPTTRWAKAMAEGQPGIGRLLREVEKEQAAAGVANRVSLAFEVTAPFLVENDRIQEYLRKTDRYDLTQVLLDLPTAEVAAEGGAMEYRLTPEQKSSLVSLLSRELGEQLRLRPEMIKRGVKIILAYRNQQGEPLFPMKQLAEKGPTSR